MAQLIFHSFVIGVLVVCVHSFTIRDFLPVDDVPDHTKYAAVARYIVHKSAWASIGTISTSKNITGFPMVNLKSVADSAKGEASTGNIYFYLTTLDFTGQDLLKSNKVTMMFTNDQDLECSNKGIDPMDPSCGRIILSGSVVKVDVDSDDYKFGKRAFVSRHPVAEKWIKEHSFFLCKLEIFQIIVLDWYGGAKYLDVKDYYDANESLNGFLNQSNGDLQKLESEHQSHGRNADKTRIKIMKGDEVVLIEL